MAQSAVLRPTGQTEIRRAAGWRPDGSGRVDDALVDELYGITDEERKIIEGG